MNRTTLAAQIREKTGKGVARRLRDQKKIPAVIYGPHQDKPLAISVDPKALREALQAGSGLNTMLTLDLGESGERVALLKEFQRHPVTRDLLHADFYEVSLDQPITVSIPLVLVGTAIGETKGGVVSQDRREVEVNCLPRNIPEQIEIDVSGLDIAEVIHMADVKLPEGVELRDPTNFAIAVVTAPVEEIPTPAEVEAAEGEEAAAAEEAAAEDSDTES